MIMEHYDLIYSKDFQKVFRKLDPTVQKLVAKWIKKNLENTTNPRIHGKALKGDKKGLWRYRIGDYRLIVDIEDSQLIVLILTFGHRSSIYK